VTARTSAIVLAGGRSERFGSDKMRARLDGAPLMHHVVRAAAAAVEEVWVVVAHDADPPDVEHLGLPVPVKVVRDLLSDEGPLAGAYTGLAAAEGEWALLLTGDAPRVPAPLLRGLVGEAMRRKQAVALLEEGRLRPAPAVYPREGARAAVHELLVGGERRLRRMLEVLPVVALDEWFWRPLDEFAGWRRDIDTPEDLATA